MMSLSYTFIYILEVRKICKSLSEKGMSFRERMSVLSESDGHPAPWHRYYLHSISDTWN